MEATTFEQSELITLTKIANGENITAEEALLFLSSEALDRFADCRSYEEMAEAAAILIEDKYM